MRKQPTAPVLAQLLERSRRARKSNLQIHGAQEDSIDLLFKCNRKTRVVSIEDYNGHARASYTVRFAYEDRGEWKIAVIKHFYLKLSDMSNGRCGSLLQLSIQVRG